MPTATSDTRGALCGRGVWLCRECHSAVHRFFDEQALGRQLNTLAALQADPLIQRHPAWARKLRARR